MADVPFGDPPWYESTGDLLREPDPGPMPWLVEKLVADFSIANLVGSYKVAKSYTLLELGIAVVTGKPAFGEYAVPNPGPVLLVMEESSRDAYHRRIDMLSRGYALTPDALNGLHFSANRRVRLSDPHWQERLLLAAQHLQPRAIFLDPWARMKGSDVDDDRSKEVDPVLDFLLALKDETKTTVLYSAHTGHQGEHQRGTSSFEGFWESRLHLVKEKDDDEKRTLTAAHRDAESGHEFKFTLAFDSTTRSLRMRRWMTEKEREVEQHLREHPDASKRKTYDALGGNKEEVFHLYDVVKERLEGVDQRRGPGWSRPLCAHLPNRDHEHPLSLSRERGVRSRWGGRRDHRFGPAGLRPRLGVPRLHANLVAATRALQVRTSSMIVVAPTRTFSLDTAMERWNVSRDLADTILYWMVAQQFVVEIGDGFVVTDRGRGYGELLDDVARELLEIR